MTDEVDIFSNFYIRKPPIITYKRKQTFSSYTVNNFSADTIKSDIYLKNQEKENNNNNNVLKQKNDNIPKINPAITQVSKKDVFDFPDEDNTNSQVEIRVASTFHTNNHNNNTNNNNNNHNNDHHHNNNNNNKRSIEKVTNGNELQHKKIALTKPKRPTFLRTKSAPQDLMIENSNTIYTNVPLLSASSSSSSKSSITHLNHIINNKPKPTLLTNIKKQPQQKKSLVSRLKSADGICNEPSNGLRLYDDDNEPYQQQNDMAILSNKQVPSSSLSFSSQLYTENKSQTTNYNQKMERDIEELLRSEFGEEFINAFNPADLLLEFPSSGLNDANDHQQQEQEEQQRPRYIPENTIRAPVTYKRSHSSTNKIHHQKNDFDSEIERQIQDLLS
ncbi:hypothetical protein BJ944DRAFT_237903 [Cunninghamella echinulata]|nr:hypothetical protein BJ944DRAFT_237903 [Cunninghamella echinulata]